MNHELGYLGNNPTTAMGMMFYHQKKTVKRPRRETSSSYNSVVMNNMNPNNNSSQYVKSTSMRVNGAFDVPAFEPQPINSRTIQGGSGNLKSLSKIRTPAHIQPAALPKFNATKLVRQDTLGKQDTLGRQDARQNMNHQTSSSPQFDPSNETKSHDMFKSIQDWKKSQQPPQETVIPEKITTQLEQLEKRVEDLSKYDTRYQILQTQMEQTLQELKIQKNLLAQSTTDQLNQVLTQEHFNILANEWHDQINQAIQDMQAENKKTLDEWIRAVQDDLDNNVKIYGYTVEDTPACTTPDLSDKKAIIPKGTKIQLSYPQHNTSEGCWMKYIRVTSNAQLSYLWIPIYVFTQEVQDKYKDLIDNIPPAAEAKTIHINNFHT